MDHPESRSGPAPREAFGHPAVAALREQSSDDPPGHEDYSPVDKAAAGGQARDAFDPGEALPPRSEADVPKESLAQRAEQE
jgi:hypothetical protein